MRKIPAPDRVRSRVRVDDHGCWIWRSHIDGSGYGRLVATGAPLAHRFAYEAFVGPVPAGLELDHLCRVRACVNPDHLEPVTRPENMRRRYATYTHCVNGHEFTTANTYTKPSGHRDCRTCVRDRVRKYQSRERAA